MAKKFSLDQTEEKETKVAPKKPVEKFYAKYANFHFCYNVIGLDGKPALQTNSITGNPVYDVDGNPLRVIKMERFETLRSKMSQGFLSVASYDPNDESPQAIERGKVLRSLAAQSDIRVYTEDEHEKSENFDKWVEKKRRIETEKELEEYKAKAAKAEELEKRLAEIEGK